MKKNILKLSIHFVVAILLFYGAFWLFFQFNDTFPSFFTTYSENFNEDHYNKITIGENREAVVSLLGRPIDESIYNHYPDSILKIYWYTKAKPIGLSYDKIFIIFHNNKVVEKKRIVDSD